MKEEIIILKAKFKNRNSFKAYRKHFVLQGHKARTSVMPQRPNTVIKCKINLKLAVNVSPNHADKMHFDSWPYDQLSGFYFKKCPWGTKLVFTVLFFDLTRIQGFLCFRKVTVAFITKMIANKFFYHNYYPCAF